jgi:hypothetical protein
VLGGVAQQDRAVSGHRVDGAAEHLVDALGVSVEAARCGALGLDVLERGRAGHRADLGALDVLEAVDVAVRLHQQLLAGDVVGPCLAHDGTALVGDGVRRENQVDLTGLDERLAVVGDRLGPGDVLGRNAE